MNAVIADAIKKKAIQRVNSLSPLGARAGPGEVVDMRFSLPNYIEVKEQQLVHLFKSVYKIYAFGKLTNEISFNCRPACSMHLYVSM